MSKILTFLDAGVLLSAARANAKLRAEALGVLNDPDREFVSSDFIRLETELKCDYYGYQVQVQFYQEFFDHVHYFVTDVKKIVSDAYAVGKKYGLNALDALHIAAALIGEADEFITTERPNSPFQNVKGITIFSLYR